MEKTNAIKLPGLNCGLCGYRSCDDFAHVLIEKPEEIKRCIHLDTKSSSPACDAGTACAGCTAGSASSREPWTDSLGRKFDFILDKLPNDPGPRETIRPHNPMMTRELDMKVGDILIGRPLGMSCGCPITHCGVVMKVDQKTGVMDWCVTGPLGPRSGEHKDIGYYSAEAYDGLVLDTNVELKIGMRYWFMPHRCMLQWRHSGLVNFLNRTPKGLQIRVEGLMIG
jgi:uncharacterized Fe-S cluster-containing protein